MRESKVFGERSKTKSNDSTRIKYFLLFEGSVTESIYFSALNDHRSEIGILPIIDLIKIERRQNEDNWSNPKKLVQRLIENINESLTGTITYESLIVNVIDCLYFSKYLKNNGKLINDFEKELRGFCENKLKNSFNGKVDNIENTISDIVSYFRESKPRICKLILNNFLKVLEENRITYSPDIDKICLIVDRDRDSFTERQYSDTIDACKNNKFDFYVTNPCFEFWLLLHFPVVLELDKDKLLSNTPISTAKHAKSFIENELRKQLGKYKKAKYDAAMLIDKVDIAIDNEKKFCEDLRGLKDGLGSNLGLLISKIRLPI